MDLADLTSITRLASMGPYWSECNAVMLDHNGHECPTALHISGSSSDLGYTEALSWSTCLPVSTAAFSDHEEVVEQAAYGLAILAVRRARGLQFVRRVAKGDRYDILMSDVEPADLEDIFADDAAPVRLEVSGIATGPDGVYSRVEEKVVRYRNHTNSSSRFIAVVAEYSEPLCYIYE